MPNDSWFTLHPKTSNYWPLNRECLRKEHSALFEKVQCFEDRLDDYQFQGIGQDCFLCRDIRNHNEFEIYSQSLIEKNLPDYLKRIRVLFQRGTELVILAGGGLGYLASHIEEEIRGDLRKGILFVENRPEVVLAMFCLFDCKALIESKQIIWALGEAVEEAFETVVHEEALFLIDPKKVSIAPERNLQENEKQSLTTLGKKLAAIRANIAPAFKQKQKHFSARMSQAPNLEQGGIWAVATPLAYAHTPLIRALVSGFEAKGWRGHLLELHDRFSTRFRVQEHLLSSCPDLILTVNNASNTFLSPQLKRPRISWILDEPRYFQNESFRERLSEKDIVFYCDRSYAEFFRSTKAGGCYFLPSTSILNRRGEYNKEFAAKVLFVGNFHGVLPHMEGINSTQRDWIIELLEHVIQEPNKSSQIIAEKIQIPESTLHDLHQRANEFAKRLNRSLAKDTKLDYFLYAVANSYKRYKYVNALLDHGIVIYGPKTWHTVLGDRYSDQYRGWLPTEHLADVYASADVCLNVHSLQCPTSLNPRDFDVLAARGCLITDEVEDFTRLGLTPGREAEIFGNVDELVRKVDELLDNKNKREEIRDHGHETYLKEHTPAHRAKDINQIIKEKFNS